MHFKQIEMTGFKSFADRTIMHMETGTTAVVGPNGCGKSNILDAVRWALGEQSAKALRGGHMQDVIFNGSELRSATGMAEVTLTFDNADSALPLDFAEVQITRRVYRSGESEYLINKAPCRLRDVQELFMDTGIGTNAYSMIGQGKISMVLSSKPEDRRFLFEEAAGIIKYKSRKRVAMRKLDSAEANLVRLHDIIAEVERQMRSLKRQVNAAIRYRELSDQLKEYEIRAAWLKHTSLSERIADLRGKFAEAQNEYEKDSAGMSQLEARHEELSLHKLEVDRVLHARRETVHEIDTEMERIEKQIALIRQQIEFSGEQQERAATERQMFEEQAVVREGEAVTVAEKADTTRADIAAANEVLATKQSEHAEAARIVQEADRLLEEARARSVETMGLRAKAQTAVETLTVNITNIESQLQAIYERQQAGNTRNAELVAILEEKQRLEGEKQDTLARLEQERAAAAEREAELGRQMQALHERWQGLRENKSSTDARLNSLRELRDSYEGFAAGVRAIMIAKQKREAQIEGVVGPVGDLISTEKNYERAIEAALGGNVNNIVVEQAEAAKAAIRFLKERKAGRVTFLPLDTIRPGYRDEIDRINGRPGVIGAAIEQVRFDEQLRPAMAYLFHNTVIVENIDHAIAIARSEDRYPRMVTLDGEVVSPAGAVTGGATQHESRGLLGRSAEIAELEEKVAGLDKEIAEVAAKGETIRQDIETAKATLRDLATQESVERRALNELGVEIARNSTELQNLVKDHEGLEQERDALTARRDEFEQRRREALEQASTMEMEEETVQRNVAEAQDAAARARHAQSVIAGELSDQRMVLASLKQSLEEVERDRQRLAREREHALVEAQRRVEAVDELRQNAARLEEETKEYIERAKALADSKEDAQAKVVETDNERKALLDESETLDKELKEVRERSRHSQSILHKLELELRHDEDQLSFFQERIQTEYHVSLGSLSAEDVGTDDYDEKARENLVKELRTKLERMGTVNLMAIEEYDALTERYDFLQSQYDDLTKARQALLDVVARIDATIKEMFLETFRAVAENFHQYFRRLFNGGQARIYLVDEDDPLESGIEIEARPPGKKPQSISLLSGGEQAMTAIALLFAIFKAKPSPFCVLDEVDAPLDDANIGRFLALLEEFTVQTQFVVITHNKQTMARADALYGVTQQERGVSQLVSVRFDEVRAEPAA